MDLPIKAIFSSFPLIPNFPLSPVIVLLFPPNWWLWCCEEIETDVVEFGVEVEVEVAMEGEDFLKVVAKENPITPDTTNKVLNPFHIVKHWLKSTEQK